MIALGGRTSRERPGLVRLSNADVWPLVGLLAVAVGWPLVAGLLSGTLHVPRNDDWSYRGPAMVLYTTGRLELDGAAQAMLIGQLLLVQPLLWLSSGADWAFLVAGILFDVAAVVAAYLLARQLLARPLATLVAALVPLFPGYLPYAISFMTDVPAAAAQWASLAVGVVALGQRPVNGRALAVALAIGGLGFAIREFAIAAPAAILVALLCAEPRRARSWLTAIGVTAGLLALRWWRTQLPGSAGDFAPVTEVARQLVPAATTVGFVLLPVALVAALRWHRAWRWRDVAIGTAIAVLALASRGQVRLQDVVLDNLMSPYGTPAFEYLIGGRPRLFSIPVWSAIGAVALAAFVGFGAVLGGVLGGQLRQLRMRSRRDVAVRLGTREGLLVLFVVGLAVGLAVFGTYRWLYDRYLWPLIPPLAVLLLRARPEMASQPEPGAASVPPPTPRPFLRGRAVPRALAAAAGVGLAGLFGLSSIFLLNSDAFDGARWRAGERLVAQGFRPETVDAGPEWVGAHPSGRAAASRARPDALTWWQGWWPDFRMCAFAASTPQSDARYRLLEVQPEAYRLFLVAGPPKMLYLYAVMDPTCPPGST